MAADQRLNLGRLIAFDLVQTANDQLRGVDHPAAGHAGIGLLPVGECRIGEFVRPADVIPVVDMQRQRDHIRVADQVRKEIIRQGKHTYIGADGRPAILDATADRIIQWHKNGAEMLAANSKLAFLRSTPADTSHPLYLAEPTCK